MVEIVFITSNREKLAHARYLARDYDVYISKQKNYGIGYIEPRVNNRDELFDKSIIDAYARWKKNVSKPDEKFFFIEDTSVNIPTLSKPGEEFPGLNIKFWMKNNTFSSIDEKLIDSGNDRTSIVRSDVALVLSADLQKKLNTKYKIFTSQVTGKIIDKEIKLNTQPYFSWLSSKTFNKWFVPAGSSEPLSVLPISEADKYDFRYGSFNAMLSFLEEHGKIKKRRNVPSLPLKFQRSLFKQQIIFIVCGPSCAGKTTLAEYLVRNHNFYHFEASDFMYVRYFEHHGVGSGISIGDFATVALRVNPTIVVDQILQQISQIEQNKIIITGFRSPSEVTSFKARYNQDELIEEVFVDAALSKRYSRSLTRARGKKKTFDEFQADEKQQAEMGLSRINEIFSTHLANEETVEEYYKSFEANFSKYLSSTKTQKPDFSGRKNLKLEDAILFALYLSPDREKYFTTTEISNLIINNFPEHKKSKNNISRYFNQNFHCYFEIKLRDRTKVYRLSQTGLSHAVFLGKSYSH